MCMTISFKAYLTLAIFSLSMALSSSAPAALQKEDGKARAPAYASYSPIYSSVPVSMASSSPRVADLCFPLLKSYQPSRSDTVTPRTQRPAGTTNEAARFSALGLILGARFALAPPTDIVAVRSAERICRQ